MTHTQSGPPSADETMMLWRQYKASNDPKLRDRLVLTLAPLVKYIVYKKVREIPARCGVEDFISCGVEALIRSIDRYDPAHGATLEQFVWTRVHGAVLDELRRNDWAPRSLRRWERDIAKARERFQTLYHRAPTQDELAAAVGVEAADLDHRLQDIARSDVGSLNALVGGNGEGDSTLERVETLRSLDQETNPEWSAMRNSGTAHFRAAFDRLPERDRKIAVLMYVEGMTFREIGEILGLSSSRVFQIHGQLKRRLRETLSHDSLLPAEAA